MTFPTQQLALSKRVGRAGRGEALRDLANNISLVVATHGAAGGRGDERTYDPFCVRYGVGEVRCVGRVADGVRRMGRRRRNTTNRRRCLTRGGGFGEARCGFSNSARDGRNRSAADGPPRTLFKNKICFDHF